MTKQEFLDKLRISLNGKVAANQVEEHIRYYPINSISVPSFIHIESIFLNYNIIGLALQLVLWPVQRLSASNPLPIGGDKRSSRPLFSPPNSVMIIHTER